MEFMIFVGGLYLIAIPVIAIIAIMRTKQLKDDIERLKKHIEFIKRRSGETPEPVLPGPPEPIPEEEPEPEIVPTMAADDIPEQITAPEPQPFPSPEMMPLKSKGVLLLLIPVVVWMVGFSAHANDAIPVPLQAGIEAIQKGEYESGIALLSALIEDKDVGSDLRGQAYYQRGRAYWAQEKHEQARADFDQAVPLLDAPAEVLRSRARLLFANDKNQSFQDVLTLARTWPGVAKELDIELVGPLIGWLQIEGREDNIFDLSEALVALDYRGTETGEIPGFLTIPLARMYIERGREFDAIAVIRKITDFYGLMELRIDRRLKSLWNRGEFIAATDPEMAMQRDLNASESRLRANPKSLEAIVRYVVVLRMLGRSEEAVIFSGKVINSLADYQADDENTLWLLNEYIYALGEVDRMEQAFVVIEKILALPIDVLPSLVNQKINFSEVYLSHGQVETALDMANSIDQKYASTYGKFWIFAVQICAYHELGEFEKADEIITDMLQSEKENYAAVNRALLCRNRLDDSAVLTIRRLQDPNEASAMLLAFQNYLPDTAATDHSKQLFSRLLEVRNRPDVMAAIEKIGRIVDIPIKQTYWGRN